MQHDENIVITQSTARNLENISKAGLKDGAADGQAAEFQKSFDEGYLEGFSFGFQLGLHEAEKMNNKISSEHEELKDPGKINCQLCLGLTKTEQDISELLNVQKVKNLEFLGNMKTNK